MGNINNSLIDISKLSKPATVLIERVSDAVGGAFRPFQIERVAKANANAKIIETVSEIQINELQQRALNRFLHEEVVKQNNIEDITKKSLPYLNENANPKEIDQDWLVNFFDKAKLISDNEMQLIWSKILAEEANRPGFFTKRTINFVSSLDKNDAIAFNKLCHFVWSREDGIFPLIFSTNDQIYKENNINFENLTHLDSIGLIRFEGLSGFLLTDLPDDFTLSYKEHSIHIELSKESNHTLNIGKVLFTVVGKELYRICDTLEIEGLIDYAIEEWRSNGYKIEQIKISV